MIEFVIKLFAFLDPEEHCSQPVRHPVQVHPDENFDPKDGPVNFKLYVQDTDEPSPHPSQQKQDFDVEKRKEAPLPYLN